MYNYFLMDVFVTNPKYKNEDLIVKFNVSKSGLIIFGEKLKSLDKNNYLKEYHVDSSYRNINTTLGFYLENNYSDFILMITDKNKVFSCNHMLHEKKMIRKSEDINTKNINNIGDALIKVFVKNENLTDFVGDIVFKISINGANILGDAILNAIKMGHTKFAIPCVNNRSHLDYITNICTEKNKLIFIIHE